MEIAGLGLAMIAISVLLFISDSTRLLCQEEVPDLVFVDEMEVRGRQAKVKLWSLPVGVKGTAHAN